MILFLMAAKGSGQGALSIPAGHSGPVGIVRFSPDGEQLLTGGRDGLLKLWDARSGLLIRTLYGHENRVLSAAFSPGGNRILSSDKDLQLNLWDARTGRLLKAFPSVNTIVLSLAFFDERSAILGGMNGKIFLLGLEKGEVINTLEHHRAPVGAMALLQNDGYLVSADWDGQLLLWNLLSNQLERIFSQGGVEVTSIAEDQAGYFYTGDRAGKLKLWFKAQERPERSYDIHPEEITAVGVIPGHQYGAPVCVGKSNELYIGKPTRAARLFNMERLMAHGNWLLGLGVSPDGRQLAACSWDGEVFIWDTFTGSFLGALSQVAVEPLSVGLSEDERYALLGLRDGSIHFIDLSTGRQQYAFPNHLSWVTGLCFAPGLTGFASASLDKTVQVQKLGDKKPYRTFREEGAAGITAIRYWPDGEKIIYAMGDTLRLRAIESGEPLLNIPVPTTASVKALHISETNGRILAAADSTVFVWDEQGRLIHRLEGHRIQVSGACFSPDGRYILTASWDKTACLWDAGDGQLAQTFEAASPLLAAAFSGAAEFLTASENGDICRWKIGRKEPLLRVEAHERPVSGLAAGATVVLSISEDHSLKIWRAVGMEEAARFIPLTAGRFVTVLPNGYYSCSSSRALLSQIGLWEEDKIYPLYLKDAQLNRPDLVASNMPHPDPFLMRLFYSAYQERLLQLGIPEQQFSESFALPGVSIQNKSEIPAISSAGTASLKVAVVDSASGLHRVEARNLGILQWSRPFPDEAHRWEGEITVGLASGANEIEVSATNRQGLKSLPELVYINKPSAGKRPALYLLAIGVSEYTQPIFNLNFAAKDAADIAAAFRSNGQFNTVHTMLLTNQDVSRESVRSALARFEPAGIDDVVIVYYSGQGILDKNYDYYLATHQTDFENPGGLSIAADSLEAWIESLKPLRKLLILDACYSGEVEPGLLKAEPGPFPEGEIKFRDPGFARDTLPPGSGSFSVSRLTPGLFVDLRESSLYVIASAHAYELAMEGGQWQNGLFTYAFLSGLAKGAADANGDRSVTAPEIFQYTYRTVTELSGGIQRPSWRGSPPRLDFPIWRVE